MSAVALAPAKVNLFLHVAPPDAAGMHALCSLAVFADVGDRVEIAEAGESRFHVGGAFGETLGRSADNLILRAVAALGETESSIPPLEILLQKDLPVAAGLGGGTSDAAAALRLVRDNWAPEVGDPVLEAIMASIGADGPLCLAARPVVAEGYGERLSAAPFFPDLPAVLVNPREPSPTPAVYKAYDALGRFGGADRPAMPAGWDTPGGVAAFLGGCRNDLETAAAAVQPAVSRVLSRLRGSADVLLARVSGSGASCFALFADHETAAAAAAALQAERPHWWVRACTLGGNPNPA